MVSNDLVNFNKGLAKALQGLKKDLGATMVSQNYKGTGSQVYKRQIYVRFKTGQCIDLWLNDNNITLGGVITPFRPFRVPYNARTTQEVYADVKRVLNAWLNPESTPAPTTVSTPVAV